jgi:uncharacterized protein YwgA
MNATSWANYGLVAYIAGRLSDKHIALGKTKLQKLVFLMKEVYRVPADYRFHFYTYGPYSSALSGDVDYLGLIGALKVDFNAYENQYDIKPGVDSGNLLQKAAEFINQHRAEIDALLDTYGLRSTRDLELIATVVYIDRYDPDAEPNGPDYLADKARELKPKFSEDEIKTAISKLAEKQHLKMVPPH